VIKKKNPEMSGILDFTLINKRLLQRIFSVNIFHLMLKKLVVKERGLVILTRLNLFDNTL